MNRLLTTLAPEIQEFLQPRLEPVELPQHMVLWEAGETVSQAYFVERGVVSMLCAFADGSTAAITAIGREGCVGVGSMLDDDCAIARHMVQVPGAALAIRTEALRQGCERFPELRRLLSRYAHGLMAQIGQSAACNSVHNAEERLARWLLMTHDQSNGEELPLTQEAMARMLGITRPTVTLVARTLQRADLIAYSRGRVIIVDRRGLEDAACECYRLIRRQVERLSTATDG